MNKMLKSKACKCVFTMLLIIALVLLLRKESMVGSPIQLKEEGAPNSDFFKLPDKLECAPSSATGGAYYTKDLTPGGICGGQDWVNKQMKYEITGGIGGSILD